MPSNKGITAAVRFDDSLDTVLAADRSSAAAIEWTWRQLVDLIGRGRASARDDAIALLRTIRDQVPHAIRVASARGLERADPPVALAALFIDQDVAVAAPIARSAQLTGAEWIGLLPAMRPATRGILRLRRDLSGEVMAALTAFGATDFALGSEAAAAARDVEEDARPSAAPSVDRAAVPVAADFDIASLVARIEAHQRAGADRPTATVTAPEPAVDSFRFETDARGLIRWVEGIERGPLIGLSLTAGRDGAPVSVDGVAAGALARRARFVDARLEVDGTSAAAGSWRISGVPAFDYVSGRFTGYRGTARRPRADETPQVHGASQAGDALRQLVHELRTPANAISGFAEMIEQQLFGPVAPAYREQAAAIRGQTLGLLDAIDDLDTAARIDAHRLELRAENVDLSAMLGQVVDDLQPLAELRGTALTLDVPAEAVAASDPRAVERLLSRFMAAVVSAASAGEAIRSEVTRDGDTVALAVTRPAAFRAGEDTLFGGEAELEAGEGGPLLGTAFAFRLARRLATELGGGITVMPTTLTLRLPAAVDRGVEQATV